ncbi:hypothetical protein ACH3XW_46570 [Acanthocheilonema viteae]
MVDETTFDLAVQFIKGILLSARNIHAKLQKYISALNNCVQVAVSHITSVFWKRLLIFVNENSGIENLNSTV